MIFDNRKDLFKSFEKNLIIAEIGVFKGEFSQFIFENTNPLELHLIDLFTYVTCSGDKDGNNIIYTDLDVEYDRLKKLYSNIDNVFLHKGKSVNILNTFKNEYFDIIYIDGDHSYGGVKEDLNKSLEKIKNGGYICGHDYNENSFPEVVIAVDEFLKNNNFLIEHLTKDGCPSYVIKINKI